MSRRRAYARAAAHRLFFLGDSLGMHVLPAHYYSPVASRKQLRATERSWRHPLDPMPFAWDLDEQLTWLSEAAGTYPTELPLRELVRMSDAVGGLRYGPIEAQFLYSYVRTRQPARIVEVGSGSSTLVMSRAVARTLEDGGPATAITACDPYTAAKVADLPHVTAREIGALELGSELLDLEAGDLLFIDSTHAVRTGSELSHLYLELVPRLQPGVVIHIHDIFLPYLYPPDVYESMFDWQETTLVAALLTGNTRLRVLAGMYALALERSAGLARIFAEYRPRTVTRGIARSDGDVTHMPSSLWLERAG